MDFKEYQKAAISTATYPSVGNNLLYPALGLNGEAGEVAEKIKKVSRNKNILVPNFKDLTCLEHQTIVKEMGDCLWYIAALCQELQISMELVAEANIEKLLDRQERGVIKSEGDNR